MLPPQKILIIYPYFTPAIKAGGIVSSLSNMVNNLDNYLFYIYTSCYDLDSQQHTGETNKWKKFSENVKVYYSDNKDTTSIKSMVIELDPHKIYINGIYGFKFFLKPLLSLQPYRKKMIIGPRGMLHKGALKVKPLKKQIYLRILKWSGIIKKLVWHATDEQEVKDIQAIFSNAKVVHAKDTPPLQPKFAPLNHIKKQGSVSLVFLSLITAKKNLLFLLKLLDNNPEIPVKLDIIGPIKDHDYWNACLPLIEKNNDRIIYKGEIPPSKVINHLSPYDFFILPTLGENFGHVIFESLTAGKPPIISQFTPWQKLQEQNAGFELPLDENSWLNTLNEIINMDNTTYQKYAAGAQSYLRNFLLTYSPISEYKPLFK
jgi:glycosyltransferase involved in cell wall biosynthesis